MNILIPMSGRGKRFADQGYKDPKPFITINGYPMIYWAIENISPHCHGFENINYKFTFVCLKDFINNHGWEFERLLSKCATVKDYNIIQVDSVTEGAACTALLAKDIINNDEELIISDCDHIVGQKNHIDMGLVRFRQPEIKGGLWCFKSNDPKFSYSKSFKYADFSYVTKVVEKQTVSKNANTGTYYFKRGSDFVKYAESMIKSGIKTNNEYYIAPVYNEMIKDNSVPVVSLYLVENMISMGTPEDLTRNMNVIKQY